MSKKKMETGLVAGDLVTIRHNTSEGEPWATIIQHAEGAKVFFRIPREMRRSEPVLVGDVVQLHAFRGDTEVDMQLVVQGYSQAASWLIEAIAGPVKSIRNRRRHKRYYVDFPASIRPTGVERGPINAVMKSIGASGAAFMVRQDVDPGILDTAEISFCTHEGEWLSFQGRFVRLSIEKRLNLYGTELVTIDEGSRDGYYQLLKQLEEDETAFVNEGLK